MKKVMVVTGASTGVGKEVAHGLAREGNIVVMVSRDPGRAAAALEYVKGAAPGAEAHSLTADLSLLYEVRRTATEIKSRFPRVDVVVNNAGVVPQELPIPPAAHDLGMGKRLFELCEQLAPLS